MNEYYDGTKLLSLKDISGRTPEIYICTTNRTGGKTTYFNRLVVNRFLKNGQKFALLYRYKYEVDNIAEKFFKDIQSLFFPTYKMTEKSRSKGVYKELFLNEKSCGYAFAINEAEQIKKHSHLLSDVSCILFDEFQSESNIYCNKEIIKFQSIHTSIARGQGKHIRYVPVFMLSNAITLLNPYFTEFGISNRLQKNTKFLKGNGFVMEQGFIKNASESQKESGFNRAFAESRYTEYASENVYLNDNNTFIENVSGKCRYLATIRYNGKDYGIREYEEKGIIYCDSKADSTYKNKIAVTTDDHNVNYIMLKNNSFFIANMRYYFENGCFRFKDLKCKECVMRMLSY